MALHKLSYLAGIVDGEGCFWRGKCKNGQGREYMESRIIVENLSRELIDWIKAEYGGTVSLHKRDKVKHPTWQDINRWSIGGKKAEKLAGELRPYLIVKSEQVKKVLPEFYHSYTT